MAIKVVVDVNLLAYLQGGEKINVRVCLLFFL